MTKISWEKNAVDFLKKIDANDSNRIVKKIKQISCANLLAEAIKRTHEGKSLSVLFE